jgi:hypothetical protein
MWRDLPGEFPPWQTVYWYYSKWVSDGAWENLNRLSVMDNRISNDKKIQPATAIADSQSSKNSSICISRAGIDGGKLIKGRKGYISKDLFEQLFVDGVHLITKLRKHMKNALMLLHDRIMLRKRALIESVNNELKNMCQTEHTGHRCFDNFIINTFSALAAYSFFDRKLSVNTIDDIVEKNMSPVA